MSCGIPDFRSRDGIYARLAVDFPDLPDPQSMFDIEYFRRDPRPFFKFAKVCPPCCYHFTFKVPFSLPLTGVMMTAIDFVCNVITSIMCPLQEIYPGQFQPSPCHKFISMLDKKEKLLRNYTQNIDTLEQVAGVQRIIQCHGKLPLRLTPSRLHNYVIRRCGPVTNKLVFPAGSFATASCLVCKHSVDCEAIREDIFNQVTLTNKNQSHCSSN